MLPCGLYTPSRRLSGASLLNLAPSGINDRANSAEMPLAKRCVASPLPSSLRRNQPLLVHQMRLGLRGPFLQTSSKNAVSPSAKI